MPGNVLVTEGRAAGNWIQSLYSIGGETMSKKQRTGVRRWHNQLSVRLLGSAQVLISGL